MSRVRIIFLNRSCAQLHSLSLLPPPTTSSYLLHTDHSNSLFGGEGDQLSQLMHTLCDSAA